MTSSFFCSSPWTFTDPPSPYQTSKTKNADDEEGRNTYVGLGEQVILHTYIHKLGVHNRYASRLLQNVRTLKNKKHDRSCHLTHNYRRPDWRWERKNPVRRTGTNHRSVENPLSRKLHENWRWFACCSCSCCQRILAHRKRGKQLLSFI